MADNHSGHFTAQFLDVGDKASYLILSCAVCAFGRSVFLGCFLLLRHLGSWKICCLLAWFNQLEVALDIVTVAKRYLFARQRFLENRLIIGKHSLVCLSRKAMLGGIPDDLAAAWTIPLLPFYFCIQL